MGVKAWIFLITLQAAIVCCAAQDAEDSLLILKNDRVVVGLLPHAGGRVVLYRSIDGTNVLCADSKKWAPPAAAVAPTPAAGYVPYNGHTYWVSPQSEWWTKQDLNAERLKKKAVWPPDPYLEESPATVLKRTDTFVRFELPASPVSGVQLTKEIELKKDGSVVLRATAKNARHVPVAWGLWSNTRLPGTMVCYVPLKQKPQTSALPQGIRIDGQLAWAVIEGHFYFKPNSAAAGGTSGKAFLDHAAGPLIAFGHGMCFIKQPKLTERKKVHPSQAPVEIYQNIKPTPDALLLELEFHGEYKTLQPDESTSLEEIWQLLPYDGPADTSAHLRFLREQKLSER